MTWIDDKELINVTVKVVVGTAMILPEAMLKELLEVFAIDQS